MLRKIKVVSENASNFMFEFLWFHYLGGPFVVLLRTKRFLFLKLFIFVIHFCRNKFVNEQDHRCENSEKWMLTIAYFHHSENQWIKYLYFQCSIHQTNIHFIHLLRRSSWSWTIILECQWNHLFMSRT